MVPIGIELDPVTVAVFGAPALAWLIRHAKLDRAFSRLQTALTANLGSKKHLLLGS